MNEEIQQALLQLYQVENQIKVLEIRKNEIKRVLEKLKDYEGKVYLNVGNIIIEEKKEKVLEDLEEEQEIIETRLKILNNQKEKLKNIIENVKIESSNYH